VWGVLGALVLYKPRAHNCLRRVEGTEEEAK
jgi:hypothetical protein